MGMDGDGVTGYHRTTIVALSMASTFSIAAGIGPDVTVRAPVRRADRMPGALAIPATSAAELALA